MLTKKDYYKALSRKKLWDHFGWTYKGISYLSKNHSLNCGCSMCRARTYFKRLKNKQKRLKLKQELKKYG